MNRREERIGMVVALGLVATVAGAGLWTVKEQRAKALALAEQETVDPALKAHLRDLTELAEMLRGYAACVDVAAEHSACTAAPAEQKETGE